MIIAFDIETISNHDMIDRLPEPKVDSRLKDPAKIEAAILEGKQKQIESMALDPLTGRVLCYAMVSGNHVKSAIASEASNDAELEILQGIFEVIGKNDCRIVTWNGVGFDLPYVYKRSICLGLNPCDYGAPPLTAWTARYKTDRHYDLMQIWGGWRDFVKLDTVAGLMLRKNKNEVDVTTFIDTMKTEEGRAQILDYCVQDTRLTWELFERMLGVLFV
jgi:predicted PolB exonuclease-like 3'-5' exonuclease